MIPAIDVLMDEECATRIVSEAPVLYKKLNVVFHMSQCAAGRAGASGMPKPESTKTLGRAHGRHIGSESAKLLTTLRTFGYPTGHSGRRRVY